MSPEDTNGGDTVDEENSKSTEDEEILEGVATPTVDPSLNSFCADDELVTFGTDNEVRGRDSTAGAEEELTISCDG